MSITVSPVKRFKAGNMFMNSVKITVASDDTYATGGYALTPAQLGLNVVNGATANSLSGYKFIYDIANEKLMAFLYPDTPAGPADQVANAATVLRDAVIELVAIGR